MIDLLPHHDPRLELLCTLSALPASIDDLCLDFDWTPEQVADYVDAINKNMDVQVVSRGEHLHIPERFGNRAHVIGMRYWNRVNGCAVCAA